MSDSKKKAGGSWLEKKATPEEIAEFDIHASCLSLILQEPFYGNTFRVVTKQACKPSVCPTAGVCVIDGTLTMVYNPEFMAALPTKQVHGILKHECLHLVFQHCTLRRNEPHEIWNIAADLAINCQLEDGELPEGCYSPGKRWAAFPEESKAVMRENGASEDAITKRVEEYDKMNDFIAALGTGWSAEQYFAELMDNPEIKKQLQKKQMSLRDLAQAIKDGRVKIGPNGQMTDGEGNEVSFSPGGGDHDGWDDLTDEEKELIAGKIREAARQASQNCDSNNSWGSVSSHMRGQIRKMISREIPWQTILKQFIGMSRRGNRATSHKRLNRKYMGIHPGQKRGLTSSLAMYVDQSGSVGDEALALLFAELENCARYTTIDVYHFDTSVDESSRTEWRKGKTPPPHRTRCGGTDFTAPTIHANKNSHLYDGYLILTDGEAGDPGPSKLRRGWVIIPGRKLLFDPSKRDIVMTMKGKGER